MVEGNPRMPRSSKAGGGGQKLMRGSRGTVPFPGGGMAAPTKGEKGQEFTERAPLKPSG